MNISMNLTESLNEVKNENIKLFKESVDSSVVKLTLLNPSPDDNFRIYYRGDNGELFCDMFGTLYSCTEQGEPISPVINPDKYIIDGIEGEELEEDVDNDIAKAREDSIEKGLLSENDDYSKIIMNNFEGEGTYNLAFNGNDETQFDVKTADELLELWMDFCIENNIEPSTLEDVYVGVEEGATDGRGMADLEEGEDNKIILKDVECESYLFDDKVKDVLESSNIKYKISKDEPDEDGDYITTFSIVGTESDMKDTIQRLLDLGVWDDSSVEDWISYTEVYNGNELNESLKEDSPVDEPSPEDIDNDVKNSLQVKKDELEERLGEILTSIKDKQMDTEEFRKLSREAAELDSQIMDIENQMNGLYESSSFDTSNITDMSAYSDLEDVNVDDLKSLQDYALNRTKRIVNYVMYNAPYGGIGENILRDMITVIKQSLPNMNESEKVPYDNTTEKICPRCHKKYTEYPALSRKDNKTEICPDCGTEEALEDFLNSMNESDNTTREGLINQLKANGMTDEQAKKTADDIISLFTPKVGNRLDEIKSPISEAEVSDKTLLKNQGNVYMFECKGNSDFSHIVGENYNEEENTLENVETYNSKDDADKDYLNRCGITVESQKPRDIEDGLDESFKVVASGLAKDGGKHKKIDLYVDGKYYASTNSYKTVKDAVNSLKSKDKFKDKNIKGNFAK